MEELNPYQIPATARIGHVHLKVSNLARSLEFYQGMLGLELVMMYGNQAAFLSAGGYHHHIGLNTWHSLDAPPANRNGVGLYHTALLYQTRHDLAAIYQRISSFGYPFTGAADHGVSEALYLNDPDQNGLELYWDRPRELWPKNQDGSITMFTRALDLDDLLGELART